MKINEVEQFIVLVIIQMHQAFHEDLYYCE